MIRSIPAWVITVLFVSGCPSRSTTTSAPATAETQATTNTAATADTTSRVVDHRLAALQRCYEDALRRRPDVAGRMIYTIRINDLGTITDVIIEDDELGDPTFSECTRTKIAAWRFAGAPEDGEVTFTVVYTPRNASSPPR